MKIPDDPDPRPATPLGPPIQKAVPRPAEKTVAPGIVQGRDGMLHTNLPLPKEQK